VLWSGALAGLAALLAGTRRPALRPLLPAVLAVELAASGLIGQATGERVDTGLARPVDVRPLTPLAAPTVDAAAYLRPGPLARALRAEAARSVGRYLSLNPGRGYLGYQGPANWAFLTDQRGMLYGLEEAQGYNPVQPLPYWTYVRAVSSRWTDRHNVSAVFDPPPAALDLLQVRWLVTRSRTPPEAGAVEVAREEGWILYRRAAPAPRATVVAGVAVAAWGAGTLEAVTRPGFDPRDTVVLDRAQAARAGVAPSPPSEGPAGRARYVPLGPQRARVEVEARVPAVVVVRNGYDPDWRATVDGRPAPLLRADHFLQGVPVGPGRHVVELAYRDPWIGYGLAGSALALALLLGGAAALRARERRRRPPHSAAPPRAPHAEADTASPTPMAGSR
jgi:hypothetical protein